MVRKLEEDVDVEGVLDIVLVIRGRVRSREANNFDRRYKFEQAATGTLLYKAQPRGRPWIKNGFTVAANP
jgi:hypothetical protein